MEPRTVEQVESWSTRSVADGYAGLRELSDGEFSGAVRAGGAWLFMLNGRIVGVFEGSLDDFEDADATAYAAPHPSLPFLFSMQEQGGETRAKYYTNDTPLTEVDSTLSEGKFTGFVELSENVLSGDYYVAYYGGRSMSVAFVGASEQVVTGDDAFERAADEVGIYEVTDVDVEVTDVPEPEGDDDPSDATASGATGGGAAGSGATGGGATGNGTTDDAATGSGAAGGGATGSGATGRASSDTDASAGTTTGSNAGTTTGSNAGANAGSNAETTSDTPPAGGADAAGPDASARSASASDRQTPRSSRTTESDSSGDQPAASRPSADEPEATDQRPDSGSAGPSGAGSTGASNAGSSGPSGAGSPAGETHEGDSSTDVEPRTPDSERTADSKRTADSERTADAARETTVESTATTRTESSRDRAEPNRDAASPGASTDAPSNRPASGEAAKETDAQDANAARATGPAGNADATGDAGAPEEASGGVSKEASGGVSKETSGGVSEEAEWRETTTIPSLDPDLSDGPDETATESQAGAATAVAAESDRQGPSESGDRKRSRSDRRPGGSRQSDAQSGSATGAATAGGSSTAAGGSNASESGSDGGSGSSSDAQTRIRKLRKQLEQRKQQVEQLKERLSTLDSERNEYKRERDALRQEVERLEAKLEGSSPAAGGDAGRRLSEAEAFDGTNLFVRYESKGEATLDEAANGQVDRSDVNANLRLEHHTQFEADEASVDGDPFDAFLADSFEYEFASWIVEDLLYEIRDTGHRNALKELYEAIPKIDRVDLHGAVSAGGGEEDTRQESFDVIMRDRMGDPLVVADLNGSRDPTTGEMMGSLVDAASGVAQAHDELAGAFQVTESFFEPEALETAEAATSGGLLSREKRASFVKLSRKRGYHLCLVESRSGDFHLNVPEL